MSVIESLLAHPGDPRYESCTSIFNGATSFRPKLVGRPMRPDDISGLLDFAQSHGLTVSMRSGGHGVSGRAIGGDLVLDLRSLSGIAVRNGLVEVGSGCTWAQLDSWLSDRQLMVPGGTVSSTGVAGLTLGGGIGWLTPAYGYTCDHLVSVRGYTSNGRYVKLADSDGEAMSVMRGLGHGMMAVSEFVFEPRGLPEAFAGGSLYYPMPLAKSVFESLISHSNYCPTSVNFSPALIRVKGATWLSVDGVSFGSIHLDEWVRSICGVTESSSTYASRSYLEVQRMLDNTDRWGRRTAWRSTFGTQLPLEVVGVLLEIMEAAPGDDCQLFVERLNSPAPRRPSLLPIRGASFDVLIVANWTEPAADDAWLTWIDSAASAVRAAFGDVCIHSDYTNYHSHAASGSLRIEASAQRSREGVRSQLDPIGLFVGPPL